MPRRKPDDRSLERPAPRYDARGKPAPRPAPPSARRRPGFVGRLLRGLFGWAFLILWRVAWRAGLALGAVVALATFFAWAGLPPVADLLDGRRQGSVTLLDRDGRVFAWRGDQFGGHMRVTDVSPHLVSAVIAAEDRRFRLHPGIDPVGLLRALWVNLRAGRAIEGGSTITQQTAKVVFLSAERSWVRKLKEIPYALAMEIKYSKDDILSIYLNRVYLGAGTFGFEAAAQRYFGKGAREVGPAEAAMLAGLLKAPSRYAPTSDLAVAQGRAGVIVALMRDQGFLTPAEAEAALAAPAELSAAAAERAGGWFADWAMEAGPAFLTRQTAEDVEMLTTFDPAVQRAAEAALVRVFATRVKDGSGAQAAIVVLSADGAVRAIVGGRDISPQAGQFNRATQALRQTGSAFKPVVYAAALQAGLSPLDLVEDAPLTIAVPGFGPWSPKNYTGSYLGPLTLTAALARSVNTAAVRVAEAVGRDKVREMARALGFPGELAPGPALALGAAEAPLIDMTGVYATFLNRGRQVTPWGIREIRLRGEAVALFGSEAEPGAAVLSPAEAGMLVGMLRAVVTEGTGTRAALPDREVAGKTGTTTAARDAWFIGFSADYVVGVWMGYDDNRPLTGVGGGGLPAEIFRETMLAIHAGLPARPLPVVAPVAPGRSPLLAGPLPGRDPDEGALTASVFRDVLRGLGLDGAGPGAPPANRDTVDR